MDVDQPEAAPAAEAPPAAAGNDFTKMGVSRETMRMYYGWLFPHQDMYRWLSYGNDSKAPAADASFFQRREFCFTTAEGVFIRYQSFRDAAELAAAVRDRVPSKIDIGPVYNVSPARRGAYAGAGGGGGFAPVERELVFDIDLTDYDDVRTCGSGAHICGRCWPLMAAAIEVLDAGLRQDFGFRHVLWVYSGRRGVHAWVCDARARRLPDDARAAVANYFAVYRGREKGAARLATALDDHPAVARAAAALRAAFEERILPGQRLLEAPEHQDAVLGYIPSEAVRAAARRRWAGCAGAPGDLSVARWRVLVEEVRREGERLAKGRDARGARALDKGLRDAVLAHAYPRLDMEVSKKMNHLLKAPFCVHPGTGRVCVPIDPARAWDFDPAAAPALGELLNQVDRAGGKAGGGGGEEAWRATDMAAAVDTFRGCFLDALAAEARGDVAARARDAAAAPTLAW